MLDVRLEYCIDGYNEVSEDLDSLEQLRARLEEIKEEASGTIDCAYAVDLVCAGVGRMSIALGERSVLSYYDEAEDYYLTSLGDPLASGETAFYFGDYSLLSNKYVIPLKVALEALEFWINQKALSNKVGWTDVF